MVLLSVASLLLSAGAGFVTAQTTDSADFADLVGTWASKSNTTLTGPGFYDPVKDSFIEPKNTGISYSFTADGHFEEAYYRAVANPTKPGCPKGIMQWQHGKFKKLSNGSLELTPIGIDGRQLYSDPCAYKNSVYTRYKAKERFDHYEVVVDNYRELKRLTLFKEDGAPMMPLFIAMSPPLMLPTTTLQSTSTPTPSSSKLKRSESTFTTGALGKRSPQQQKADRWWWFGVVLTATGGTLYFFF